MPFSEKGEPFTHGKNIQHKIRICKDESKRGLLREIKEKYDQWHEANMQITGTQKKDILKKVKLFEEYKDFIGQLKCAKAFDPRGVLEPTVTEEFMFYLFKDIVAPYGEDVVIGKTDVFENLRFCPQNFRRLEVNPSISIKSEKQDFVIGREVKGRVEIVSRRFGGFLPEGSLATFDFVVPVVVIECKIYIDGPMLNRAAYAAEQIKRGNPFCKYFAVAEYIKLEAEEEPGTTRIDQMYIMRKQKNVDRAVRLDPSSGWTKNPVDGELVWDLFNKVKNHLEKNWWSPGATLGKGRAIHIR